MSLCVAVVPGWEIGAWDEAQDDVIKHNRKNTAKQARVSVDCVNGCLIQSPFLYYPGFPISTRNQAIIVRHRIFRTKWHFDWDGTNCTGDHANSD